MNEGETIADVQLSTIGGLSLSRPISIDDIRWAVNQGFQAGEKFALEQQSEVKKDE